MRRSARVCFYFLLKIVSGTVGIGESYDRWRRRYAIEYLSIERIVYRGLAIVINTYIWSFVSNLGQRSEPMM